MMWFECTHEPTELGYDPDRKVKISIGQLVEALAEALKAVEDVPDSPRFKAGDEFTARIIVTGTNDDQVNFVIAGDEGHNRSNHNISRYRLAQIKEAA